MHRFRHNLISCFALIILTSGFVVSGEPATSPDSNQTASTIADLIQQLEHSDFAQREAASRQLQESGNEAIAALLDAAIHQPPEAATRSLHILENLFLSDDKSVFEAADDGLSQLMASDRGNVVVAASQVLARHMLLREERAVAAIRELGGTVQYDALDNPRDPRQRLIAGPPYPHSSPQIFPHTIILGTKWKGGLDGLKFLRWLSHREHLVLYVIRGSQVTLAEAQSLAASLPNLSVFERGPYLGLMGGRSIEPNKCVVEGVQEGGPAAHGGVQTSDEILKLEGNDVGSFQDLIDQLKQYEAKEKITLTIRRSGRTLSIDVVLGEWTMPDYSPSAQRILERAKQHESQSEESNPTFPLESFDDSLIEK